MTATARLYRRAQIKATEPDIELEPGDYEGRALRALWTHRWLPDPFKRFEAQLNGGGSAWPEIVRERQGDEVAREPKPRLRARDITAHDIVFGLTSDSHCWFNGLGESAFRIIWYRGALGWSFQRMGDAIYRSKEDARRRYREAMNAVTTNAARGTFEI